MTQGDHSNHSQSPGHDKGHRHHHILSEKMALGIFGILLVLTAVTIAVSRIDLGALNFPVAMFVATIKALLVALFFMGLLYDRAENSVIFATSFLFLAIFIVLTSTDLFFRGDVYVKPGALMAGVSTPSKLKSPWISTPELVAHGKELFEQNCVTCHGPEGLGNGPASAGYNPKPRNFHAQVGWINGRKPSNIFKTLKEGINGSGMASFATLPVDDRWALAAYVVTFNSEKPAPDTAEDVAKIGYNLATGLPVGGTEKAEQTVPVDFVIDRMAIAEPASVHFSQAEASPVVSQSQGARIYQSRCAECHGDHAEGGIRVRGMGGLPKAYLTTEPLTSGMDSMKSIDSFNAVVVKGLVGSEMPGAGDLNASELSQLYAYTRSLASELSASR